MPSFGAGSGCSRLSVVEHLGRFHRFYIFFRRPLPLIFPCLQSLFHFAFTFSFFSCMGVAPRRALLKAA